MIKIYYILILLIFLFSVSCREHGDLLDASWRQGLSNARSIDAFYFPDLFIMGRINETSGTIKAVVPPGTGLSALIPSFDYSGFYVIVGMVMQESGITHQNFSRPVVYTVVAEDGSTRQYEVTVVEGTINANPPFASNIVISGLYLTGMTLTGSYDYNDANYDHESGTVLRWLRSASVYGQYDLIPSAENNIYTITQDDLGMYIKFEVTPKSSNPPETGFAVLSNAFGPVTNDPLLGLVINEWYDGSANGDFIEIKNYSNTSSATLTNSNFEIRYGNGQSTIVRLLLYLDNGETNPSYALSTADGVVIAPGEIFLVVDRGMETSDIETIRNYDGIFTGKIFLSSESALIGFNDRLDENFACFRNSQGIIWSKTPDPVLFGSSAGTGTTSYLLSGYALGNPVDDFSQWGNDNASIRTAGFDNP